MDEMAPLWARFLVCVFFIYMVRWLRRIKAAREYRECDGCKEEKHINVDIAGQRFGRRSRLG